MTGCDGKAGRSTIRRWIDSIIERSSSRYSGAATRRPWLFLGLRCPDRPGRGSVMRWILCMTDPCSKEAPVIEVEISIGGARVCRILDRVFLTRPLPETLILDNGPEF